MGGWPFGRTSEPDPDERVSLLLPGASVAQLRAAEVLTQRDKASL